MITIEQVMTEAPLSVASGQSLSFALEKMKEHNVRHLPVMEGGKLTGMLSERDIRFIESYEKIDLKDLKVDDAYTDDPYTVIKEALVKDVCKDMAEKKLSSAMVVQNGQLIGIFTWIDALKVIQNHL
ncbi:CBS domain-containing protein [Halobacteriovorax sp. GB3]|uniref:CBS domain-containing protein n=1 Tax=Halobacteriovorax sp. GB3 TaxID=2719615 RepID=UPI0023607888|nr:CBS domain-containing protein [Halobacteriovorax sp. GB3]MDD0851959.1 CBS domain-containing protein [Halobacteriovorax sp. GB3]